MARKEIGFRVFLFIREKIFKCETKTGFLLKYKNAFQAEILNLRLIIFSII